MEQQQMMLKTQTQSFQQFKLLKSNRKFVVLFKDEANSFKADNANNDKFKSSLFGNTEADGENGILKHATTAIPLKYVSNFWRLP